MYVYIDESGNTGQNLFDPNQPSLLYGVLSSPVDLDVELPPLLAQLGGKYGFGGLHAAELGVGKLVELAPALTRMQRELEIKFDLYRIDKRHHAIICFFDQVFDSAMNEAVPWIVYWSPLRYLYLLTLAELFDEALAERAWKARINLNSAKANQELVHICRTLIPRAQELPDPRARDLITGALEWAAARPGEICYNVSDRELQKAVAPNVIAFQSVLMGLANRCERSKATATRITIDEQSEFNRGQVSLHEMYRRISGVELPTMPPLMPKLDLQHLPDAPLLISTDERSAGLQLADVYLWLTQRFHVRNTPWPTEFSAFSARLLKIGLYDEVSLNAVAERWLPILAAMPEPGPEQKRVALELRAASEKRRAAALESVRHADSGI